MYFDASFTSTHKFRITTAKPMKLFLRVSSKKSNCSFEVESLITFASRGFGFYINYCISLMDIYNIAM